MSDATWGFSTRAVHAGEQPRQAGEVAPGLHLSTTFSRDADGELLGPHLYARGGNPNRAALDRTLLALEAGASLALTFSSGLAATAALLRVLRSGDRVVVEQGTYYGVMKLFREIESAGVVVVCADLSDAQAARAALAAKTAMVWCETPTNPMLRVADIALLAQLAHAQGAVLVVDSTIATPLLQSPLKLGADAVLHAATKALGGHSDLTLGALFFADSTSALAHAATTQCELGGAAPSPFDCWLLLRGLATAALRIRAQEANASAVAHMLAASKDVVEVLWPLLPSHPQCSTALKQMRGGGSVVSLRLKGGETGAAQFMSRLHLFTRATSFGGVHSLAEHRFRVEGPQSTTPKDLVRLALGVEDTADLLSDLEQALAPR
ncbi:MAG: cystathionine gamma-synthase [Planctomycetes bacterium]|nr:cystathionine gamma-synthase [Planctomycetota bacterium]